MSKKRENEKYSSVEYWNDRFSKEKEYDWIGDYEILKDVLGKNLRKQDRILMVGCGNSKLTQQMYKDGFTNILSTDISEVCIANQKIIHPHLQWEVADLRDMKNLENESFDAVIEKSTFDCLLVKEKSPWHPSEEAEKMMGKICTAFELENCNLNIF